MTQQADEASTWEALQKLIGAAAARSSTSIEAAELVWRAQLVIWSELVRLLEAIGPAEDGVWWKRARKEVA